MARCFILIEADDLIGIVHIAVFQIDHITISQTRVKAEQERPADFGILIRGVCQHFDFIEA